MATVHRVNQGEDIASIGAKYGWLPKSLWDHPDNKALKELRKDPNVLLPGDVVKIPERRPKEHSGGTEQRHKFYKKISARLKLRFTDNGKPMTGAKYVLDIDGVIREGQTDGEGGIDEPLPANARSGIVYLGERRLPFPLSFGGLDPVTEISGAQGRLKNLGLYAGDIDGKLNAETAQALREFQANNDLPETGQLDQTTQDKLKELHGG